MSLFLPQAFDGTTKGWIQAGRIREGGFGKWYAKTIKLCGPIGLNPGTLYYSVSPKAIEVGTSLTLFKGDIGQDHSSNIQNVCLGFLCCASADDCFDMFNFGLFDHDDEQTTAKCWNYLQLPFLSTLPVYKTLLLYHTSSFEHQKIRALTVPRLSKMFEGWWVTRTQIPRAIFGFSVMLSKSSKSHPPFPAPFLSLFRMSKMPILQVAMTRSIASWIDNASRPSKSIGNTEAKKNRH